MNMKALSARTLLLALGLLFGQPLLAHNKLTATGPAADAALDQAPQQLELSFNDATYLEQVELLAADGKAVELQFTAPAEAASHFSVPLPALGAGSYMVKWAVEGTDTHTMSGEFKFTVGAAGE
jgi:methionine-rich copper-binding protein CopC